MHKAHVYIGCSDKCLRKTEKMTGFIKILPDGKKWKFIGRPQTITYNRATLWAFVMAVRSLEDNYELHVYSNNGYVLSKIEGGDLQRWSKQDFKGKDGNTIRDDDLWRELAKGLKYQKCVPHIGNHIYEQVMEGMFAKEREKKRNV